MKNLERLPWARIDRQRPVHFTFDDVDYRGFVGDTLASALLANGVKLVGRSYKYHRPRGILTAGSEEPNALVAVDQGPGKFTPNVRATEVEIFEGMKSYSQNRWPWLRFDIGAINQLFSPILSAGFYYKTFIGSRFFNGGKLWHRLFEPLIRRAAGLGNAPTEGDPDHYGQFYCHCDLLIVGAGPAGLAAALAAAPSRKRIIVCDEQSEMGGSLLCDTTCQIDGKSATDWLKVTLAKLARFDNVRLMSRAQVFGYYAQNFLGVHERCVGAGGAREKLWQIRAGKVIIATGAHERPLVFKNNDLPGIMLANAGRAYLNRYGVKVGDQVVVVCAHDSGYRVALDLHAAGVSIAQIADLRPTADGPLPMLALAAGLPVLTDCDIVEAQGFQRVRRVAIGPANARDRGARRWVDCDVVLMAGGWTPSLHLYSQSRGRPIFDAVRELFLPLEPVQDQISIGACCGQFALADCLDQGMRAGVEATGGQECSFTVTQQDFYTDGAFFRPKSVSGMAFVDYQNDVCAKDIDLAVRESMHSIEHIKRYTTTGMATDQGKLSNMNALALSANALGKNLPQVGLTTFRPPYTPVTFGVFAGNNRGDLFDPLRKSPIHPWAEAQAALFENVSLWKRAWYFPQSGEDLEAAIKRECVLTRANAGFFDASTLGKIEVQGPDAATFLDLIYTIALAKLEVGRCRYGLMLNEAGFIIDDGIVARLAADRFHVTTTTGGAARVLHHMEDYLQTEFSHLRVWLTSITEQWAVIAIQGPRAREILAPHVQDIDISAEAMPHMSVREGTIYGLPLRLMRVSFTGEMGFEINVPSDYALSLWEILWREGQKYQAVVYGTETMHVLRAEKGYIIVGQETDGTVIPQDVGLSWAVGKQKKDFVGKRALSRPDMLRSDRKQLIGLLTRDPAKLLEEGAQITKVSDPSVGSLALGHVTSAYHSAAVGRSIALALVAGGRARLGHRLFVPMPTGAIEVTITEPIFFDKQGDRLNG